MLFIRGAVTVDKNEKEEIWAKTKEMISRILEENELKIEDIQSMLFTATRDVDAAYPAVAARELGLTQAALMCVQEMYVEGSLPMCIRVMVIAEGDKKKEELTHVYLGGAARLRPDWNKK